MTSPRPHPNLDAPTQRATSAEHDRLAESPASTGPWRLWGPYLAGRQWGTVREDYSADGDAWRDFPFEVAHQRAYRWGEDGLGGFCDRFGFLNIALALWNRADDRLKERLFGVRNDQGNHGEDVKEYWWAVDGTPTHSYAEWLYRYPQAAYPYELLRAEAPARSKDQPEYELADTAVLDENRFFDVRMTWAKAAPDDLCLRIEATNNGPDAAPLHILPQVWFRNTWAWGRDERKPSLRVATHSDLPGGHTSGLVCDHAFLGRYYVVADGGPDVLVCDNETDSETLWGSPNRSPYPKDGINRRVVHGDASAINPAATGTKAAFWYQFESVPAGATVSVVLRISVIAPTETTASEVVDTIIANRRHEADEFYAASIPAALDEAGKGIARRAFAGLLWNKQLYRFTVDEWLTGDPGQPPPPPQREQRGRRNTGWRHLALADVMSMPDEWEYPWFAAWDLAFHCVALAHVDPAYAKEQLLLLCREWAMHPNGQLPAYEWEFGDVNPPVHAWAAWQVYLLDGSRDTDFLVRILSKLLLNFGWWVNRKDADDTNLFEGGFLGMDNIGLFDRSAPLPPGFRLEESDATSWMAFYCLSMLTIAVELARQVPAWDEVATKFLEHFLAIAHAMQRFGSQDVALWDDEDGFFYDVLVRPDGSWEQLKVRSMVGLLPLLAVGYLDEARTNDLPDFTARLRWLQTRRPDLLDGCVEQDDHLLLSLLDAPRLGRVLSRMFDPAEFLSDYGIRSLSAAYREPYSTDVDGQTMTIDYEPGESRSWLFGGNSNWRGPIWFPVNVLLADALRTYGEYFGERTFPVPGGAITMLQAADEIDNRLIALFRPGPAGARPADGTRIEAAPDPLWRDHVTFNEYFHGDTGAGLGASHQTGWTALVAHLLCRQATS